MNKNTPTAINSEKVVIASIIINNRFLNNIIHLFSPEIFVNTFHIIIVNKILELYHNKINFDSDILRDYLKNEGSLNLSWQVNSFNDIINHSGNIIRFGEHFANVYDCYVRKQMLLLSEFINSKSCNLSMDIQDIIDYSLNKLNELNKCDAPIDFTDIKVQIEPYNIKTGFNELDENINGWKTSTLYLIAGRPSSGKTDLAFKILSKVPKSCLFSLELNRIQIKHKSYPIPENSFIYDDKNINLEKIYLHIRFLKDKVGINVFIIDFIQLIIDEIHIHAKIMRLKEIATELNVCIITFYKMQNSIEAPILNELISHNIDADIIMFLHEKKLILAKNIYGDRCPIITIN